MKKKILSIMLGMAIFGSSMAIAAPAATSQDNTTAQTEKVDKNKKRCDYRKDCVRKDRKCDRKGDRKFRCDARHAGHKAARCPFTDLNLTEEQQAKVQNPMKEQRAKRDDFRKKCDEDFNKEMKKILNADQLAKYEKMQTKKAKKFQKMEYRGDRKFEKNKAKK